MRYRLVLGSTCTAVAGMVLFAGIKVSASDEPLVPGTNEFYAKRVVPILQNNCLKCHDDTAKGGLQLDSYSLIRKGGQDGPVIVPGDLEASMLIQAIRRSNDLKMPPKYALKDTEVADLEAWVKAGAVGADFPLRTPTVSVKDSSNSSQDAAPASAASPTLKNVSVGVDTDFFENKVRPIFANNCYECHTDQASGGMRLDSKAAFDQGGGRGPLIVPGNSDKSLLIQAVKQTGTLKMPRGGKLSEQEVAILEAWVQKGAPWPSTSSAIITSITARTGAITEKQRQFWSFQPLRVVQPPEVQDARLAHWPRTAIDRFILAGLHSSGLAPVPETDRRTLIRRATYDLTGLPPTQEEVNAFLRDKSANAWEKVLDRLLASPRYGERWGRHWLDVARYAEDDVRGLDPKQRGYMPFPGAFRYRDWVIKAFNADLPYDRFVTMQLAGDKLPFKDQNDARTT
jgi:hypothetical protein